MRSIILVALLAVVRADVSHLNLNKERHYLPPELPSQKPLRVEYEVSRPKALPVPSRLTVPRSNLHTFVADLPLGQRLFTPAGENTIQQAQGSDHVLYATAPNSVFHTQINVQSQGSEFNAPSTVPFAVEDEDGHDSRLGNFANNANYNSYPSSNGLNDFSRQSKHEHEDIARRIDRIYDSQHRSQEPAVYRKKDEYDHHRTKNRHNQRSDEHEHYQEYKKSHDGFNGKESHDNDHRRDDDDSEHHTEKSNLDGYNNKHGHKLENHNKRTLNIKDGHIIDDHHSKKNLKTIYNDSHGDHYNHKIEDKERYHSDREIHNEYDGKRRNDDFDRVHKIEGKANHKNYQENEKNHLSKEDIKNYDNNDDKQELYHTHDHSERTQKIDHEHRIPSDKRTHHNHDGSKSSIGQERKHRNQVDKKTHNHSRSHISRSNNDHNQKKQSNYQGLNLINGNIDADQAAHLPQPPPNFHGNTQGINVINGNLLGKSELSRQHPTERAHQPRNYEERKHHERHGQLSHENPISHKGNQLTALDRSVIAPSAIKIIAFNNNNVPLPQIQNPLSANEFDQSASAPEVIYKSGDEIDFAETKLIDYEDNRQPLESYKFTGKRGPKSKTQRVHDQSNLHKDGYHYNEPRIKFNS